MAAPRGMFRSLSKGNFREQSVQAFTAALKAANLDARHSWMFSKVAKRFGIEESDVEDYVLNKAHLSMVNNFFKANGPRKLLWYYQPAPVVESDAPNVRSRQRVDNQLFLTNGEEQGLTGLCVYFLRLNPDVELHEDSIDKEVIVGLVRGDNLLKSIKDTLECVMLPALKRSTAWDTRTIDEDKVEAFIEGIDKFVVTLSEVMKNMSSSVTLRQPDRSLPIDNKPSAYVAAAADPRIVEQCEALVEDWNREIEHVLSESEVVRKETIETGPSAELNHWKERMAKFNSITDQLKTDEVRFVIGVLQVAKSKRLEPWKALDNRITDAANEAKDNVKYLYTLERFSEPLYKSDPVQMVDAIPGLINAIKMMHSIARYYNTSERMTALFVKITNQMIMCCRRYIQHVDDEVVDIWEQPRDELLEKFRACIRLNKAYQDAFHQTKSDLAATPNHKQFDFSEMYIFGKFELFCKRLHKLIDMFIIIDQFSLLKESSIEGMDEILERFNAILEDMQGKHYNLLDDRQLEFETDYVDFYEKIINLERFLLDFINASFEPIPSTERALKLLQQFETVLKRESLTSELQGKYRDIFNHYNIELEVVRRLYEKGCKAPPIPRDTPQFAGAIAWARQLSRRIEGPMRLFEQNSTLLDSPEFAKPAVKLYNRLYTALYDFEEAYYTEWTRRVSYVKDGLNATLLIRDADKPKNRQLFVNFDYDIVQVIRETKAMQRMGKAVPDLAKLICTQEDKFKAHYNALNFMLQKYNGIQDRMPAKIARLLSPHLDAVGALIEPGLVSLTWTSLNIGDYLASIHAALDDLADLIAKATDILECRIDSTLAAIADTLLVDIGSDVTATLDEFVELAEAQVAAAADAVDAKNVLLERAVRELVSLITADYTDEDIVAVDKHVDRVYKDHALLAFEAILRSVRSSMESLKDRIGVAAAVAAAQAAYKEDRSGGRGGRGRTTSAAAAAAAADATAELTAEPLFSVEVELALPNVEVTPRMEQIQQATARASSAIQQATKRIYVWNQDRGDDEDAATKAGLRNYYLDVSNHKDVVKLHRELSAGVGALKTHVSLYLETFSQFDFLWRQDYETTYEEFLRTNPTIEDFEARLSMYAGLQAQIDALPSVTCIAALRLDAAPLKAELAREASAWKQYFGNNLKSKSHRDMNELFKFMEDATVKLNRQVNDLDEIRAVMDVLAEIREEETEVELRITPIEETYSLLNRYDIKYSKEEAESADTLSYTWRNLKALAQEKQGTLMKLQPGFRAELESALSEFNVNVAEFVDDFNANGPMERGVPPRVAVERLKTYSAMFDERERKRKTYNGGEELFGLPKTEYKELKAVANKLKLLEKLYGLYSDVIMTVNGYDDKLWVDLNLETISTEIKDFGNRCAALPGTMKDWPAFLELKKTIDDFEKLVPILIDLANPAVKERHWDQISVVTRHSFKLDPDTFKLAHVTAAPLLAHEDEVMQICSVARGEADVEVKLRRIVDEWSDREFVLGNFPGRGEIILNSEATAEITLSLEDSLMALQSLQANRNNGFFLAEIQDWLKKLNMCLREIEMWQNVQKLWIYLEAVFNGGDISKAMPTEAKRFATIDKSWTKIMSSVKDNPNVVAFVYGDDTLKNLLPPLLERLEQCQGSLAGYLEKKQQAFPRFYFLSNPALLEVLGSANSDSHAVKPHLSSVFANIGDAKFSPVDPNTIVKIISQEGEEVDLHRPMECEGNVEDWLNTLVTAMKTTVKEIIFRGFAEFPTNPGGDITEYVRSHRAQVCLIVLQIMWTSWCEDAFREYKTNHSAIKNRDKANYKLFDKFVAMTREHLDPPRERVKVETLVTIHLNQCKVFNDFTKPGARPAVDSFDWQKQARFYLGRSLQSDCVVKITDIDFPYCYEYLGCTDRLVVTDLTARCYITLAQALGMSLGGAPAGPAGTGKTETVKDMGKALGKYVVVFNCSPEHEYREMETIFKGIAMSGCWGDFDEFNRIKLPVLSVCAAQIQSIFAAKKARELRFLYTDNKIVHLDPECGIFITMNPGYAGRQELPENLKLQFRTVAMMVPNRETIMEVKLASAGFADCGALATKFFWLYYLCEEQLSKQRHYDFGLRNILSVLRTAGKNRRVATGDEDESQILQRVCRDMNLSKLVDDDYGLFLSLLRDLFQDDLSDARAHNDLEQAIENQCYESGLTNDPHWNLKLFQLYETAAVRWGVMVLGPAGAGKSTCIRTLLASLTEINKPHKEIRMNPKAIEAQQYLGCRDGDGGEWKDGVFSALWKRCNETLKKKPEDSIWLTMDGPIDSLWIESLNTVLDDNKTLTLPSGDRLPMHENLKLVFEVDSVRNASPATVSRAGMIYVSDKALGWQPVYAAWSRTRGRPEEAAVLDPLFTQTWDQVFTHVKERCTEAITVPRCVYILTATDMLNSLLPASATSDLHITRLFVFAIVWSLGGLLDELHRASFGEVLASYPFLDLPPLRGDGDSVYDYVVDASGEWIHWDARVPSYKYPTDHTPVFYSVLVPTVASVRLEYLMSLISSQGKSVLLVGESGTAKTVGVLEYVKKQESFNHKIINFSSATTPRMFQDAIQSFVGKSHGNVHAPIGLKPLVVFIDDVSMPQINQHGDQPTNEIVRQLMEAKGFYDVGGSSPDNFLQMMNLQFIAAMFSPGGGRNDVPARLKRHFSVFYTSLPDAHSIDHIFSTIVTGFFCSARGFAADVVRTAANIVPQTRVLWNWMKDNRLPTPDHFHYVFNLRDLSRITEGLIDVDAEVVSSPKVLLKLWKHECERVLNDKIIDQSDRVEFASVIDDVIAREFGGDLSPAVLKEIASETYFCDFLRDPPEIDFNAEDDADFDFDNFDNSPPKIYEPVPSMSALKARLEKYLVDYNDVRGQHLDLVLFDECMRNVIKVARIIRRPRGHALLVGVGGSGKQSVTRLAAFIAGHRLKTLEVTRAYTKTDLIEDLRIIYKHAGGNNEKVTLIFTDNDIKDESFLEYVNTILTSGQISHVIQKEDLDALYVSCLPFMHEERPDLADSDIASFFVEKCRANLHVVLCFSPVGEKLRSRVLRFPGIVSGCSINWFQPWPVDALLAVAEKYLGDFEELDCTAGTKRELVNFMCDAHFHVESTAKEYVKQFRRHVYVTPKSYLTFINSYKAVYVDKKAHLDQEKQRMLDGVAQLNEADRSVQELQRQLLVKNEKLKAANEEAAKVLAEVKASAAEAERETAKVMIVKNKVEKEAEAARQTAEECQDELEKALPYLEDAEQALRTIHAKDINELRQGNNPVHFTQRVLECVRILRYETLEPVQFLTEGSGAGYIKTTWKESVGMMKRQDFMAAMEFYPRGQLNGEIVDLLEPYFEDETFTADRAFSINHALKGVYSWTKAMMGYFRVATFIEPKMLAKDKAARRLDVANAELAKAEAALDEKQAVQDELQVQYDIAQRKKMELLEDAQKTERTMTAARALTENLKDEKDRWQGKSVSFGDEVRRLVGDVAIATAFVSYAGPFNQQYRGSLLSSWQNAIADANIPLTTAEDGGVIATGGRFPPVQDLLVTESTVGRWNIEGLPSDDHSIQNGVIVTNSARLDANFPLLIDPQSQGLDWILSREQPNGLVRLTPNSKVYKDTIENCVSSGVPLLIEDFDPNLDPILNQVLEKGHPVGRRGDVYQIHIGDKPDHMYHVDFRLYLVTNAPNPRYSPEIFAKASVVDFSVTLQGLEDQLLVNVVQVEREDLEQERKDLLEKLNQAASEIARLEAVLLSTLSDAKGDIPLTENQELIDTLSTTKSTSKQVAADMLLQQDRKAMISQMREQYRRVATRGSVLYFLIVEMAEISPMYQTSLQQFLRVFNDATVNAEQSKVPESRIDNIIEELTFSTYRYVARGLIEEHKFLFLLQMALKIDMVPDARPDRGALGAIPRVKPEEYMVFIKGGAQFSIKNVRPLPANSGIQESTWLNLYALSQLRDFLRLLTDIEDNLPAWREWDELDQPEEGVIPGTYGNMSPWHKLLLIRCWREDRMYFAAKKYIEDAAGPLGPLYTQPLPQPITSAYEESSPRVPILCLLSLGSDPSESIRKLAKDMSLDARDCSMGQEQDKHARRIMAEAMTTGDWVLLQNCHLDLKYMEEIAVTLATVPEIHSSFRLWLTTEPAPDFPMSILHMAIKVTNEPPQGMKAGLRKTFANNVTPELLEGAGMDKTTLWQPLLFSVCYMYSVLQERRKFGALGWNVPYEFNESDLDASISYLQKALEDGEIDTWQPIQYMLCEVHFGGRVTDNYDRRLINTFGQKYLCDNIRKTDYRFDGGFPMPTAATIHEYEEAIDRMPDTDSPLLFSLNNNADVAYRTQQTQTLLATIVQIQPKEGGGVGGKTRDDVIREVIADLCRRLEELPTREFVESEVREAIDRMGRSAAGEMEPQQIFFHHEVRRMQAVLTVVERDLRDLSQAMSGAIILTDELNDIGDSLFAAIVPESWVAISWPSSRLESWMINLEERNAQYTEWLRLGRLRDYDLSGFFNPQGFLTAILQEFSQAQSLALDGIMPATEVVRSSKTEAKPLGRGEGVYLRGLTLEGANWDRGKLREMTTKEHQCAMPLIRYFGVNKEGIDVDAFCCVPVYKNPERREDNRIAEFYLPTGEHTPQHWILRGVALLATNV